MTVQELIDTLEALPAGARTAQVQAGDCTAAVIAVLYEKGIVTLECDFQVLDDIKTEGLV